MPEKQLTIAGYAAGASLAAITLVYVFAPTFFIDGDANGTVSGKKRGAVGLVNNANDCFINSTLQALSGLGDLRLYLIREIHRRDLDGDKVYGTPVEDPARRVMPLWKIDGLQKGIVTQGLKTVLDQLNERPLYKKTISAHQFVVCLETAFRQRISRQQQDAQEFLQVVAERLCDEYHAGRRARRSARRARLPKVASEQGVFLDGSKLEKTLSKVAEQQTKNAPEDSQTNKAVESSLTDSHAQATSTRERSVSLSVQKEERPADDEVDSDDDEEGFPFEGKSASQIECLTCGFQPKPSESTFCSLTLSVPQVTSTTLNACFDGMFKTEYIDDFKCEKCRLIHAASYIEQEAARSNSEEFRVKAAIDVVALKKAIEKDPEQPPSNVILPDGKHAPQRRIARHQNITKFPKVMAIHLSRSIFDVGRNSMKNSAKVSFPERLPLGGILDQKKYKLLGVVTHKGSHHSGHYESFRRQNIYAPFSTPNAFSHTGAYSKSGTPTISTTPSPQVSASRSDEESTIPPTPDLLSSSTPSATSRFSSSEHLSNGRSNKTPGPTSAPREKDTDSNSIISVARSARSAIANTMSRTSTPKTPSSPRSSQIDTTMPKASKANDSGNFGSKVTLSGSNSKTGLSSVGRKKKKSDKWWRISDDKVKESTTKDVLGMQKEVYLLFYELEREGEGEL